jgi:hypothetical protein
VGKGKVRPDYLEVSAQLPYPFIFLSQVRVIFSFILPLGDGRMGEPEYVNVGFDEPDMIP